MQLTRGARVALDFVYEDLQDILTHAHNPAAVQKLARRAIQRLQEEIEPKLQRRAPAVEQRLVELEERLRTLEQRQVIVVTPDVAARIARSEEHIIAAYYPDQAE